MGPSPADHAAAVPNSTILRARPVHIEPRQRQGVRGATQLVRVLGLSPRSARALTWGVSSELWKQVPSTIPGSGRAAMECGEGCRTSSGDGGVFRRRVGRAPQTLQVQMSWPLRCVRSLDCVSAVAHSLV
eukprot:2887689-Rhodomonas_salina.3